MPDFYFRCSKGILFKVFIYSCSSRAHTVISGTSGTSGGPLVLLFLTMYLIIVITMRKERKEKDLKLVLIPSP